MKCEKSHGHGREDHAQHDRGGQTPEDHLAPVRLGNARRRHADDDGIVAGQDDVDQDDLEKREEAAAERNGTRRFLIVPAHGQRASGGIDIRWLRYCRPVFRPNCVPRS